MELPFNINIKDPSSFAFYSTIAYVLIVGYNIGEIIKDILDLGYTTGRIVILIIFSFLFILGMFYFIKLLPIMMKRELFSDKLIEEQTVSEVIDQDYKLLQMKILETEHNMKVRKWNTENKLGLFEEFSWRNIESISKQALDPNFYEKTYGHRIIGKK